jgi:hypothetical protein
MKINNENGKYILSGVLQKFSSSNGGRIYDKDVFERVVEDYDNKIKKLQRDENIDALIEDREANDVEYLSLRPRGIEEDGYIKNIELDGDTLKADIIYHPKKSIENINIGISSRSVYGTSSINWNEL